MGGSEFGATIDDQGIGLNGLENGKALPHIRKMKNRWISFSAVCLVATMLTGGVYAQEYPWEPAKPYVYTPKTVPMGELPKVERPTHLVPGHKSTRGFVRPYRTDGPVMPPLAPGEKSSRWVPGHTDANGEWVPGHPQ